MQDYDDVGLEVEEETEEDEDEVPVEYDIASYPSDFTLSGIAQMWADQDIVIPDFQREFVWTPKQSSLLIDSFLCGLPVPPVFFYVDQDNKNLVVDGQQRILSVAFYLEGYFGTESTQGKRKVFRLSGIDERSPYYNRRFEELEQADQRRLRQAVLRAINIRQLNPAGESTSAYHIFERLNTGGTALRPQEIRNCVFRGELNSQLRRVNEDESWRQLLGRPYLDKHQKDVELILRIFALAGTTASYEKPMKEFLNRAMKKHSKGNTRKARRFLEVFPTVARIVVESLGQKPFHLRGPLNVSALDSVMCVLIENHQNLKDDLSARFQALRQDPDFDEYTRRNTTDTKVVLARMQKVREYMG